MVLVVGLLVAMVLAPLSALAQGTLQTVDGWEVRWDGSRGWATRGWQEVTMFEPDEALATCESYSFSGHVLSVVGSVVSYETRTAFYCEGTPRPRASASFGTVDLRTGADVDIRLLVPDAVIVEALKQDPLIATALGGRDPLRLQDLIDTVDGGCEVSFLFLGTSFAFYDVDDNEVTLRFGLTHGCEVMGGNLTEIDVSVPMPRVLDLAAAEAEGHLMKDLAPARVP